MSTGKSIVQSLMDTAVADSQLLVTNQEAGDRAEIPRDIDFVLYARDEEKAKLVDCDRYTKHLSGIHRARMGVDHE